MGGTTEYDRKLRRPHQHVDLRPIYILFGRSGKGTPTHFFFENAPTIAESTTISTALIFAKFFFDLHSLVLVKPLNSFTSAEIKNQFFDRRVGLKSVLN